MEVFAGILLPREKGHCNAGREIVWTEHFEPKKVDFNIRRADFILDLFQELAREIQGGRITPVGVTFIPCDVCIWNVVAKNSKNARLLVLLWRPNS